jgi:hypothetical protein
MKTADTRQIIRILAVCLALAGVAAAQQLNPSSSSSAFHQSMGDAWWTGPLLAPSANTLPQGHILVEPYLYDVITQGFYNSNGTRVSAPHGNEVGSLT